MLKKKNGSYVYKEYVLTPCKNVENSKISWWLTKIGYTLAVYAFTASKITDKEIEKHIKATIPYFEEKIRRM